MTDRGFDWETPYDEARRLLDYGFPKKALRIGRKLEKQRHTSGIEIRALAQEALGHRDTAIKILRRGVRIAPGNWLLGQLLGNLLSADGQLVEAIDAYDRVIDEPEANRDSLRFNKAAVLEKLGRNDEALSLLRECIEGKERSESNSALWSLIHASYLDTLRNSGRVKEALLHIGSIDLAALNQDEHRESFARLLSECGRVYLDAGDTAETWRFARHAVGQHKTNEKAQWLLRELRSRDGQMGAQYFRLLIEGRWLDEDKEPPELLGFFTTYEVVADSEDEAQVYVEEFEPDEIVESLALHKVEIEDLSTPLPKGVYFTAEGYSFFSLGEG